ncbi:MAG: 1-acyl-sn-glycerol-3-phosphate acyltransferase [Rhodocyclales bacterium]|nr:1-acyl-sn-glycerol-3-phosphate acyltransferase [Rhodocyclales bacterium]
MAFENMVAGAICGFAKLLTGVRAIWRGSQPEGRQRVYFANHRSHGDFVLIWASLPPSLRRITRPVAGADYWLATPLSRYIGVSVFRSVLIDRSAKASKEVSPIAQMSGALSQGDSLIIFPEGTRNLEDGLLPFKSGIYHLACANPEVEFIPVWIENVGRVMPKGAVIPVPLLCTLTFGSPMRIAAGEDKQAFLNRAREALSALSPAEE